MADYHHVYKARQKSGEAKSDNNSITVEGALDLSGDKFPKVPPKPSPQLPVDDAFAKFRTSQA
jgi:hypothetical protein